MHLKNVEVLTQTSSKQTAKGEERTLLTGVLHSALHQSTNYPQVCSGREGGRCYEKTYREKETEHTPEAHLTKSKTHDQTLKSMKTSRRTETETERGSALYKPCDLLTQDQFKMRLPLVLTTLDSDVLGVRVQSGLSQQPPASSADVLDG